MITDCGVISGWQRVSANPLGWDQEFTTGPLIDLAGGSTVEFLCWYRPVLCASNSFRDGCSLKNQSTASLGVRGGMMGRAVHVGDLAATVGVAVNYFAALTAIVATREGLL